MGSRRRLWILTLVALLAAACGSPAPSASPAAPSAAASEPAASPAVSGQVASPAPSTAVATPFNSDTPIATSGSIALLGHDGSLWIIDAAGTSRVLADASAGTFGFPTWSPDGSRIATVRTAPDGRSVVIFDTAAGSGLPTAPRVIFSKPPAEPFYLFWSPDGKSVSFLSTETEGLELRIAPADGSAPIDGSGKGSIVRSGNPFYYDWLGVDRLIAHIGTGTSAYLGELGLDGKAVGTKVAAPGDFRSAVASHDGKSIAYLRDGGAGAGAVVVAARDGSAKHTMEVFGSAAINFDPSGDTVAVIGASKQAEVAGFPVGPLRLMDRVSGKIRTLIDGSVVIFWWSPDGSRVAALRIQDAIATGSSPSPGASPAEPDRELRLLFVDVATGEVTSQPVVQLGAAYVNGFVAYFDQYALSHHVWAPDGSSILLPETDNDGVAHVTVRYADGRDPIDLGGEIAFWSP